MCSMCRWRPGGSMQLGNKWGWGAGGMLLVWMLVAAEA